MKFKSIYALMIGLVVTAFSMSAFAADDQASQDDMTVVGACMVQKFTDHVPSIPQDKMDKCSDVEASAAPKCLGLTDDEYGSYVKFCISQLSNAKCVAGKMKTTLMQYANCGYEKDPVACYKGLGFTMDDVVKLSTECEKEGAK
jgi:hypothetical protein